MSLQNAMWVEKYRPQKLEDVVGQQDAIKSLESLLKKKEEMPHLLFAGSAGIGKTTVALCMARQILGDAWQEYTLELNASDERGINMVREKVKKFSYWAGFGDIPFKIVILDEADEMTSDAQTALRRIIEDTAKYCRFVIIANNISRIIDPIQSRCAVFKFAPVSQEDIIARLKHIAGKESVKADDDGVHEICDYAEGDLRHAINLMQTVSSAGSITVESVRATAGLARSSDVSSVLKLALDGSFAKARETMIELTRVYGMSESDFLKYMNAAVWKSGHERTGDILEVLAKYDYRLLVGSSPDIQLSALLAEIARIAKEGKAS